MIARQPVCAAIVKSFRLLLVIILTLKTTVITSAGASVISESLTVNSFDHPRSKLLTSETESSPAERRKRQAVQRIAPIKERLRQVRDAEIAKIDALISLFFCWKPAAIFYGGGIGSSRAFVARSIDDKPWAGDVNAQSCPFFTVNHEDIAAKVIAAGSSERDECFAAGVEREVANIVTELIQYCIRNRISFIWDGSLTNIGRALDYKHLMDKTVNVKKHMMPYKIHVIGVSMEAHIAAIEAWNLAAESAKQFQRAAADKTANSTIPFVPLCTVYQSAVKFAGLWKDLVATFGDETKSNIHLYDVTENKRSKLVTLFEKGEDLLDLGKTLATCKKCKPDKMTKAEAKRLSAAARRFEKTLDLTPVAFELALKDKKDINGKNILEGYKALNKKCGMCGQSDVNLVDKDGFESMTAEELRTLAPYMSEPCEDKWSAANNFCQTPAGVTLKEACLNGTDGAAKFRSECPRKCGRCYSQDSYRKAADQKYIDDALKAIEAELLNEKGSLTTTYLANPSACRELPFAIFFGGGSGAGKGRAQKLFMDNLISEGLLEPSALKECAPFKVTHDDYVVELAKRLGKEDDFCFGPSVGRDVGALVTKLIYFCIANRISFIWDGTLTNLERAKDYKQKLEEANFRYHIVGVTVAIHTAALRSWQRGLLLHKAGYVPPASSSKRATNAQIALCMIFESHTLFSRLFPDIVKEFYVKGKCSVSLYANNVEGSDELQLLFKDGAFTETYTVNGTQINSFTAIKDFEDQVRLTPLEVELKLVALGEESRDETGTMTTAGLQALRGYKDMNVQCGFCSGDNSIVLPEEIQQADGHSVMMAEKPDNLIWPVTSTHCRDRINCDLIPELSTVKPTDSNIKKCFEQTSYRFNCPRTCGRCYGVQYVEPQKTGGKPPVDDILDKHSDPMKPGWSIPEAPAPAAKKADPKTVRKAKRPPKRKPAANKPAPAQTAPKINDDKPLTKPMSYADALRKGI